MSETLIINKKDLYSKFHIKTVFSSNITPRLTELSKHLTDQHYTVISEILTILSKLTDTQCLTDKFEYQPYTHLTYVSLFKLIYEYVSEHKAYNTFRISNEEKDTCKMFTAIFYENLIKIFLAKDTKFVIHSDLVNKYLPFDNELSKSVANLFMTVDNYKLDSLAEEEFLRNFLVKNKTELTKKLVKILVSNAKMRDELVSAYHEEDFEQLLLNSYVPITLIEGNMDISISKTLDINKVISKVITETGAIKYVILNHDLLQLYKEIID